MTRLAGETRSLSGLMQPAQILIDRFGIAHIRAESLDDLFLAQGFNAARDRLWQIDLWRKRGLGLLAADFGAGFLAQDFAARMFLYRGDMEAEWAAYAPDAERICAAFCHGVNAYIALCEVEPDRLPTEFALMNTQPARWSAADIARIRTHGLSRNLVSEVRRASVLARCDEATDDLRSLRQPSVSLARDRAIDCGEIPPEVLTLYNLATAGVSFSKERLSASLAQAWQFTKVTDLGDVIGDNLCGSNNWVVSGTHTRSGRPIMANDPHRTIAQPSLRYLVHLTAPGFDAIGAGEPAIPGISIGHNGSAAFGLTIFYSDQEDLYVYETEPGERLLYRFHNGFEAADMVEERFAVRGEADQHLSIAFTRHGPILYEDRRNCRAFALRSVWFEPGSAPYLKSLASMRSRDFASFRGHMRGWGVPSVNHVYADVSGLIAWLPAGWVPIRPNWTGLLPVAGDGRYEWQGFLDPEKLPRVVNPAKGYFATANEMNLPDSYGYQIGYEWVDAARATRINEVLAEALPHSVESSCALQMDVTSQPARRLQRLVYALPMDNGDCPGREMLTSWDCRILSASAAAAYFEVWWSRHLRPTVLARLIPDEETLRVVAPGDLESVLRALETPDARWGGNASAVRDGLLIETLNVAWAHCKSLMGDNPMQWAWGDLHRAYFEHPLSRIGEGASRDLDIGPLSQSGSASTPMHSGYWPADFRVVSAATVRLVIDVGDWDNSRAINAPGQSGDSRSPFYSNLAAIWAQGDYVPLLYSEAAVNAAGHYRIRLLPKP